MGKNKDKIRDLKEKFRKKNYKMVFKSMLRSHSVLQTITRQNHVNSTVNIISSKRDEASKRRSEMFTIEKQRQIDQIPRVNKIEVQYKGIPEDVTLYMNKGLSTPFNVAQHISEVVVDRSALALVNGKVWDMHRPLEEECSVELLHFHQEDPFHVNRTFWRSCSFMLGGAVERSFKAELMVQQHSFPPPNVASGSFVADIDLGLGHD